MANQSINQTKEKSNMIIGRMLKLNEQNINLQVLTKLYIYKVQSFVNTGFSKRTCLYFGT